MRLTAGGLTDVCKMKSYLLRIDEWLRHRLRMCIWKQWKRIKTKFVNLQKPGTPRQKAWEHANTGTQPTTGYCSPR
jgi:hypothetical protein